MLTYSKLRNFAQKLIDKASEWRIPFEVYQYSPEIGNFIRVNQISAITMQTKYVITFPEDAYDDMQYVIDAFSPIKSPLYKGKDSLQKGQRYGRDVYQGVSEVKLSFHSSQSPEYFTIKDIEAQEERLLNAQKAAFSRADPQLSASEQQQIIINVRNGFKKAKLYLLVQSDPEAQIAISRDTHRAHKLKIKPTTGSKLVSYRNVAIFFSDSCHLPKVELPQPKKPRKKRNDSRIEQARANPTEFKFYQKVGIFEIYDK